MILPHNPLTNLSPVLRRVARKRRCRSVDPADLAQEAAAEALAVLRRPGTASIADLDGYIGASARSAVTRYIASARDVVPIPLHAYRALREAGAAASNMSTLSAVGAAALAPQTQRWVALDGVSDTDPALRSEAQTPEDEVARAERSLGLAAAVAAAMWLVTPREREMLQRLYLDDEDRSMGEVAEMMGISRQRVAKMHQMAVEKLRMWKSGLRRWM